MLAGKQIGDENYGGKARSCKGNDDVIYREHKIFGLKLYNNQQLIKFLIQHFRR